MPCLTRVLSEKNAATRATTTKTATITTIQVIIFFMRVCVWPGGAGALPADLSTAIKVSRKGVAVKPFSQAIYGTLVGMRRDKDCDVEFNFMPNANYFLHWAVKYLLEKMSESGDSDGRKKALMG